MPAEFCFVPHDQDQSKEFDHTLVEPGTGIWLENYASGEREVVGVICAIDDNCGYLVIPDISPDTDLDELKTEVPIDELPEFLEVLHLDKQCPPQEIEFDDGDGARGYLRARYVGGYAITCSNIVPTSLMHPN